MHAYSVCIVLNEQLATSRLLRLFVGNSSANQAICLSYWTYFILLLSSNHRVTVSPILALIRTYAFIIIVKICYFMQKNIYIFIIYIYKISVTLILLQSFQKL